MIEENNIIIVTAGIKAMCVDCFDARHRIQECFCILIFAFSVPSLWNLHVMKKKLPKGLWCKYNWLD